MKTSRILLAFFLIIAAATLGCGDDDGDGPSVAFDGGVLFGANCTPCHAPDASDVSGTTVDAIIAAIANPTTGMASLDGALLPEELAAVADYLATGMHADGWRREGNHGDYAEDNGVSLCELCHGGPDLTGEGTAPSCFSCHGRKW